MAIGAGSLGSTVAEAAGFRPASAPAWLQWVDPEAMARISRVELLARHPVEGFISGRHRSPYRG